MSSKSERRHNPKPAPSPRPAAPAAGATPAKNPPSPSQPGTPKHIPKQRTDIRGQIEPEVPPAAASPARVWLMRLALLFLTPVLLLCLGEAALRICGYGYPVSFFVRTASGDYITNQKFAWQFFSPHSVLKPFLFSSPAQKPAGTLRICILGESAAMGTPDPAFSFGRILEAMLRRQYPQSHFEIMNAAMRGINSHVIRLIAQECAQHQVDVFIVYMGNNEVVGLHAPAPNTPVWTQSLSLIRAGQRIRRTRLGQLLAGALLPANEPGGQDMESFRRHRLRADDIRREKNRANFRANLQEILQAATGSGSRVLLCTVGCNLKDLPPFGSLHRADLTPAAAARWNSLYATGAELENKAQFTAAIEQYLSAEKIDDHYAELQFRLGRCYNATQDWTQARKHFELARDWDALQFRTDSRMNQIIRDTALRYQAGGVRLLDMEKVFAENALSQHGLPGAELFYEHVHPTFAGNYLLARACDEALVAQLQTNLPANGLFGIPTAGQCAEDIAYTFYDDVNVNAAMVRLTAGPPFLDQLDHSQRQAAAEADSQRRLAAFGPQAAQLCLNTYAAALARRPDDWPIHFNLAALCEELKRYSQAIEHFEWLVARFPAVKAFRIHLGNSLMEGGNKGAALAQYKMALALDPGDTSLRSQVTQLESAPIAP